MGDEACPCPWTSCLNPGSLGALTYSSREFRGLCYKCSITFNCLFWLLLRCVLFPVLFTESPSAVRTSPDLGAAYRCPGLRQHYLTGSLCP